MTTVYKLVSKDMRSLHTDLAGTHDFSMSYKLGEEAVAKTGLLFVFGDINSVRVAQLFLTQTILLICEAQEVIKPWFDYVPSMMLSPQGSKRLDDFNTALNGRYKPRKGPVPLPIGTLLCECLTPIRILP